MFKMTKAKKVTTKKRSQKEAECDDVNCPTHGSLSTRGIVLEGTVVSDKMDKTIVLQRSYHIKLKKYDRYRKVKSRILAHNPPCINAKTGDKVRVEECRKLSSKVSFVVTEKID